jgi:hypothetical protein
VNLTETHDLLTFVASYDNRRFDDATVLAWQPIFADFSFGDCRKAVVEHFGTSDAYLMPVHIRRIAVEIDRDRRRQERERREQLAITAEASDPTRYDRSEALDALIAAIRDQLGKGTPDKLRPAEWVEHDRRRERIANAVPNPHYDPNALARLAEMDAELNPEAGAA